MAVLRRGKGEGRKVGRENENSKIQTEREKNLGI